jgi:hypothetical protein
VDRLAERIHSLNEPLTYKLYVPPSLKIILSIMPVVFVSVGGIIVVGPVLFRNWTGPPWFVGFIFLAIIGGNALWVLGIPHTIMFHQDETVEFTSVLRSRRIPVREVVSIKPEGTTSGFLVVRTESSKIRILAQFDGFHDFLTRLKALNPAVELRGC